MSRGTARKEITPQPAREIEYTVHSTLEDLPGYSIILDSKTTGEELDQLFSQNAELPGVILLEHGELIGIISQSHYYKCISRAFGREIYRGRSATLMLKDMTDEQVILMADCRIQTAVERCLARPMHLVYEPFLVYSEQYDTYRVCSFQILLLASSRIAALRNGQMAQILNSVTDGLLVIDRNFKVGSEYSRAAAQLFERSDLEQFTLIEALQPLIDPVMLGQIGDYLKVLFAPKMIDKLIKAINPAKQVTLQFKHPHEHTKYFSFNFERVRSGTEISQVLVRVEDVTQSMNLARELQKQESAAEERLQLILQVMRVDPVVLKEFLRRFEEGLAELETFLQASTHPDLAEEINGLFRTAHTLKGEATLLRLTSYASPIHKLEDVLAALRTEPGLNPTHLAALEPGRDTLRELHDQMTQALNHLDQLGSGGGMARSNGAPQAQKIQPLTMAAQLIKDLSQRLDKPVTFYTTVRDTELPAAYHEVVHELLLHLARNSMVHGIEPAEARKARGKSPTGTIQFAIKPHRDFHELIFQDDGGGLDYERIRQRARQLGHKSATTEDLHDAIFAPGFSTADDVTELAGRGVGLDAIRHSLLQAGGSIHVHSQPGAYCAFQVLLPKTALVPGRLS